MQLSQILSKTLVGTTITLLLSASATTFAQTDAPKGVVADGKGKAAMCIGCHGIPGYKASFPTVYSVPMIAGQNAKYIENSLKAYGTGERSHPTMRAISGSLTAKDMADLGAYYASLAPAPIITTDAGGTKGAEAFKKYNCASCHAKDGNYNITMDASYPKLAGQHKDYLAESLRQYKNAEVKGATVARKNGIMAGQAKVLSNADIENIAAFLANLKGEVSVKK